MEGSVPIRRNANPNANFGESGFGESGRHRMEWKFPASTQEISDVITVSRIITIKPDENEMQFDKSWRCEKFETSCDTAWYRLSSEERTTNTSVSIDRINTASTLGLIILWWCKVDACAVEWKADSAIIKDSRRLKQEKKMDSVF